MALLSDFYPYVLPSVPGVSLMLADQMIRDTCIDFASKSLFVQHIHDPLDAIENVSDYDFEPPDDEVVAMVIRAWFLGRDLKIINIGQPHLRPEVYNRGFDGATPNSFVRSMIQKDEKSFSLDGTPAENSRQAITMVVATKPSRTATTIADILFNEYAYEIGLGVTSRLMRIPKQPFSDPQTAAMNERGYIEARNAALLRASKSLGATADQVEIRRMV